MVVEKMSVCSQGSHDCEQGERLRSVPKLLKPSTSRKKRDQQNGISVRKKMHLCMEITVVTSHIKEMPRRMSGRIMAKDTPTNH